jgi:hypothetical protein
VTGLAEPLGDGEEQQPEGFGLLVEAGGPLLGPEGGWEHVSVHAIAAAGTNSVIIAPVDMTINQRRSDSMSFPLG